MRTTLISIGCALALVCAAGCKKDKKKADETTADDTKTAPAETPPAETPPPETPPAEPPPDPSKPDMANKMANCPSAAAGATTAVKADKAAVTVTVTAKEKEVIAEIQKRAKKLSTLDTSADADIKHTGEGTGGGQLGKCPVVMTDVTLKVKDLKNGSAITMTPKDKAKVADLEKMAKERAESMPAMDAAGGGDAAKAGDAAGGGDAAKAGDAKKGDAPPK
jgi:hypothetical protein